MLARLIGIAVSEPATGDDEYEQQYICRMIPEVNCLFFTNSYSWSEATTFCPDTPKNDTSFSGRKLPEPYDC
jgi:hypothetical protein